MVRRVGNYDLFLIIFEISDRIKNPDVPIALPAQGRLVLGVTRIWDKKTQYIHGDAVEVCSPTQKYFISIQASGKLQSTK